MKKRASKKNRITVILLVAVLFAGLSLLLYPLVADYWNSMHQSQAIATYIEDVTELDDSVYDALWEEAQNYNAALLTDENRFFPDEEEQQRYEQLLSISDDGIIGYIEIPSIDVTLPIYHGTSEEVLQVAIGQAREYGLLGLPAGRGSKYPLRDFRTPGAALVQAVHRYRPTF